MYVQMAKLESKALLTLKISLEASFLSKEQIETVVNSFDDTTLKSIEIKIASDAKEFGEFCINKKEGLEHSWAGDNLYYQTCTLILGDVEIGKKNNVEYSNNGNYAGTDEEYIAPNFSLDKLQVVYVYQKQDCNFNGNYNDSESFLLVIYNPSTGYMVSPEVQYILDNFSIN